MLSADRLASQASSVRISTWSWIPMCCGGLTAAAASHAFLSTVSVFVAFAYALALTSRWLVFRARRA